MLAWALLAVIVVVMFALLVVLRILVWNAARRERAGRVLAEAATSLYARLSPLYRIRITGREKLPAAGPYVLVANHESGLDAVCLMMLRPRARFVAASWLFRTPVFGWVMRACGHVSVGRREPSERALERTVAALQAGDNVAIFPEGAYSLGDMHAFRRGAFVAAQQAAAPLVLVRLHGTGAAWRPGTWIVEGRNDIRIEVLGVVSAEEAAASPPEALAERVRDRLAPSA